MSQLKQKDTKAQKGTIRPKKEKSPREIMLENLKMEIAQELGLLEKVKELGWGGLSAAESGRVGGIMTRRLKELNLESSV